MALATAGGSSRWLAVPLRHGRVVGALTALVIGMGRPAAPPFGLGLNHVYSSNFGFSGHRSRGGISSLVTPLCGDTIPAQERKDTQERLYQFKDVTIWEYEYFIRDALEGLATISHPVIVLQKQVRRYSMLAPRVVHAAFCKKYTWKNLSWRNIHRFAA